LRLRGPYLAVVIALAAGGFAYAALADDHGGRPTTGANARDKSPSRLHASGRARGLYPGGRKRTLVAVRNSFDHPVKVRWVRTKVKDAGPLCSRHNLLARRSRGLRQLSDGRWRHARVPPHTSRWVRVRILMRQPAPDACQGATFPLRFTVKVGAWR
jgi:hypothetical protein